MYPVVVYSSQLDWQTTGTANITHSFATPVTANSGNLVILAICYCNPYIGGTLAVSSTVPFALLQGATNAPLSDGTKCPAVGIYAYWASSSITFPLAITTNYLASPGVATYTVFDTCKNTIPLVANVDYQAPVMKQNSANQHSPVTARLDSLFVGGVSVGETAIVPAGASPGTTLIAGTTAGDHPSFLYSGICISDRKWGTYLTTATTPVWTAVSVEILGLPTPRIPMRVHTPASAWPSASLHSGSFRGWDTINGVPLSPNTLRSPQFGDWSYDYVMDVPFDQAFLVLMPDGSMQVIYGAAGPWGTNNPNSAWLYPPIDHIGENHWIKIVDAGGTTQWPATVLANTITQMSAAIGIGYNLNSIDDQTANLHVFIYADQAGTKLVSSGTVHIHISVYG